MTPAGRASLDGETMNAADRFPGLFSVPAYLPYLQPALTATAIRLAEETLGVKLPGSYLEVLHIQNGGYLRRNSHPSAFGPVSYLAGIGPRFPSILQQPWDVIRERLEDEGGGDPIQGMERLVSFYDDGHYGYCLDYRRGANPSVSYIDMESFGVDQEIAPDFETFVRQLVAGNAREAIGILTDKPIDSVATDLSRVCGVRFEDGGAETYGYRVFSATLPNDAGRAWLSPNRCRRGFVRADDEEYSALKDTWTEVVDRFPEHSDCSFFVTADESTDEGRRLVESIGALQFPIRRVHIDE